MRRLRALIRKELIHMRRDPRTLLFMFMVPLLQLFLLGYAVNNDVRNVSTAVYDQDNSRASRELLDAYRAAGYFTLNHVAFSLTEVTRLIESGQASAGIVIPPNYGADVAAGSETQIAVLIDGSDPSIASSALSNAQLTGQAYAARLHVQQLTGPTSAAAGNTLIEVRPRVLYNPDLLSSYNMIPGLIGTIMQMITLTLTAFAIVRERERGTIEQLIVTPIRKLELMLAKIIPYVLVSLVNVTIVMLVGTLWFKVPIRGSVSLLMALTGLFVLPNLGIGLLVSTFAHTQQEAQIMTLPIMLPSMMLSGFLFPIASMPHFLQVVSRFIPLTYFLQISRGIIVKGIGIDLLVSQVVTLVGFSVLLLVLAALRFRKTLE